MDPAQPTPPPDLNPAERFGFSQARRAATRMMRRPSRVRRLASNSVTRLAENSDEFSEVRHEFGLLIRMVRAWSQREYTKAPWRVLIYAVAALLYFVNPADLVPDVLVGIGFVDDIAVVGAVLKAIQTELVRFERWEHDRSLDAAGSAALDAAPISDPIP